EDKAVDGSTWPGSILDRGRLDPDRGKVGPVALVLCALLDPAAENSDLLSGEFLACVRGRHAVVGIGSGDALDQLAPGRLAGADGGTAVAVPESALASIEAQAGLAGLLIGAVTLEAVLRQNGADIAVEVHAIARRQARVGQQMRHSQSQYTYCQKET